VTTKKKKKQTAKDDLIESLMKDVHGLSNEETMLGNAPVASSSESDYDHSIQLGVVDDQAEFAAYLMSEVGEDVLRDTRANAAAGLWQQLSEAASQPDGILKAASSDENHDAADFARTGSQSLFEPPPTPSPVVLQKIMTSDEIERAAVDGERPSLSSHSASSSPREGSLNILDIEDDGSSDSVSAAGFEGPVNFSNAADDEHDNDKTMNLAAMAPPVPSLKPKSDTALDNDKTVAVAGFANRQPLNAAEVSPKVSFGSIRGPVAGSGSIYAASDATLAQSESLRLAQGRILELEKEVEKYRYENDELASAGDIIRERAENLNSRISALEVEKREEIEILRSEMMILKGNSQFKDTELAKSRAKIEELEGRLKSDFKKIRVRERELENRLELVKAEKSALLRAKDENILDLKRKIDHLQSELDNYRVKVLELNKTIDVNQEQFKRTVRALRLALSNLEVKEESIVPLKKAE
jgi:hypothetical protein